MNTPRKFVELKSRWAAYASIFFLNATLSSVSLAIAQVEDALVLDSGLSEDQQPQITVYRDRSDSKVFWWAPYQFEIDRSPFNGMLRLSWSATADQPRITLVASLKPFTKVTEDRIKMAIAQATGAPFGTLDLRPLTLRDVSLAVTTATDRGLVLGEWRPQTSLVVQGVPETIPLSTEENTRLRSLVPSGEPGIRVAMNFLGSFAAFRSPSHYSRRYTPTCIGSILVGHAAVEETLSKVWNQRRWFSLAADMDRMCVTNFEFLGVEPSIYERMGDWSHELVVRGVLREVAGGVRIASKEAYEAFVAAPHLAFTVEVPQDVIYYQVAFGRLLTELQPTE